MRVLICEYVTGGGLLGEALPPSLAREARLMVETLARDLSTVAGTRVTVAHDPRLPPVTGLDVEWARPATGEGCDAFWHRLLQAHDAVWPIAPESGGALADLTARVRVAGRRLIGSSPEAVGVASSKYRTCRVLEDQGVPTVPTYRPGDALPARRGAWVVKPDDGAGCEATYRLAGRRALDRWLTNPEPNRVIQPYVPGRPLSLSLLCDRGRAELLAVNAQHVRVTQGTFRFRGAVVNGVRVRRDGCADVGRRVAAALPGLWGYVGVDLVEGVDGPQVVDVNPRLTTAYAGLGGSLGCNPAALVLDLLDGGRRVGGVQRPGPAQRRIDVDLEAVHA